MATNINDLPTDTFSSPASAANPLSLDQSTISQIVNGLQQASLSGATALPSRDIPLTTEQVTMDASVQPNFVPIPNPENTNYIQRENEDLSKYYAAEKQSHTLDSFYDDIQGPLLIAILYFLFQLPVFRRTIYQYFPYLCFVDGSFNFQGLLFTSALFGASHFVLTKTMKNFSRF